jgi:L-malate glycosyltransferase
LRVTILGPIDLVALAAALDDPGVDAALPSLLGHPGAGVLATQVAALRRAGVEASAITTDPTIETTTRVTIAKGLEVIAVPARTVGYGRDLHRQERRGLAEALERTEADVVHAHWTYEYALAALSSRRRPVVVSMHDWAPTLLRLSPHPYNVARVAMQAATVLRADAVTVPSPYLQAKARPLRRDVTVVPNSLAAEHFRVPESDDRAATSLLAVGNGFSGHKNGRILLRSFGIIRRELPHARLVLVGSGYEADGVAARWAEQRELAQGVNFLGRRSAADVAELMGRATLLVHPSREESFGMVVIEAMARGTPVLGGARSGAVPWLLGGGARGVLCDVESPRSVADAALAILRDPDERARLADAGRAHAWRIFRDEAGAAQLIQIYEDQLMRRRGKA